VTRGRPTFKWSAAAGYLVERAVFAARPPGHVARLLYVYARRDGSQAIEARARSDDGGRGRKSPSDETVRRRMVYVRSLVFDGGDVDADAS
jgi:hypothetical protein